MSLISVIIPAFNAEKTILQTIHSVLNQTYSHLEILVIDDGSQDTTLDILNRIQDSRLRVFSYANSGHAVSRNRGIALASGDYIAFLDADDIWAANKLEAQFQALQNHPQTVVAYSWIHYIDQTGQPLYPGNHTQVTGNVYKHLLIQNFLESGSNPLIRTWAFSQIGGFDESLEAAVDWEMWLRLAAQYEFVCVPAHHVMYRISPNSVSSNLKKVEHCSLLTLERCFARAPESLQPLKPISLSRLYLYLALRAFTSEPSHRQNTTAIYYLYRALRYDRSLLHQRSRLMQKVIMKALLEVVLTPQLAHKLLSLNKAST